MIMENYRHPTVIAILLSCLSDDGKSKRNQGLTNTRTEKGSQIV